MRGIIALVVYLLSFTAITVGVSVYGSGEFAEGVARNWLLFLIGLI